MLAATGKWFVSSGLKRTASFVNVPESVKSTAARFDETPIVKKSSQITGSYTKADVDKLTELTTHNPESKTALLGYFESDSVTSYEQIAHANGWTYFDAGSDGWKAMEGVHGDLPIKVNKQFLINQIDEGKEFILTADPYEAANLAEKGIGESFNSEITLLGESGYKFEKYGEFWRAHK